MSLHSQNRTVGKLPKRSTGSQIETDDLSLYLELVKHAPVGLLILQQPEENSGSFKIVTANQAATAISFLKDADVVDLCGKGLNQAFPTICESDLKKVFASMARSGCACHIGQLQKHTTGMEHVFSIQAFRIDNKHLGLAFESISERKRAENALGVIQTGLLDFLEAAPDAMLLCSQEGQILFVNSQTECLFSYKRAELNQQPLELLLAERLRRQHVLPWTHQRAERCRNPASVVRELSCRRADGSEFPAEITCTEFRVEEGLGICVAIRDITERQRAEEALRKAAEDLARSNGELEQFAHAASHDLQEPLRTVISTAQLLALDYADQLDQCARKYIALVVESSKRMQSLLDGLLKYSRVGAERKSVELVNCEEACDAATTDLKAALEESRALLTRGPLPCVQGDRIQLIQLFQNLLANAIKFRGEGPPRIHICAERSEQEWVFAVRDNGLGIDPEKSEVIFHLFRRLHRREEYPGTGIGLALCKKIVTQHGGRIWVQSEAGKGSVFFFTLPVNELNSRKPSV